MLVTCTVPPRPADDGQPVDQLELSGSGFVLDPEDGLVATSASWITAALFSKTTDLHCEKLGSLRKRPNHEQLQELPVFREARWCVFAQVTPQDQGQGTSGGGTDVICMEAGVHGAYLMESVYSGLEEQLLSLAHWRWLSSGPLSDKAGMGATEGGGGDQDMHSFLLPLSILLILQLTQKSYARCDS